MSNNRLALIALAVIVALFFIVRAMMPSVS
jgi:hypothetical protein